MALLCTRNHPHQICFTQLGFQLCLDLEPMKWNYNVPGIKAWPLEVCGRCVKGVWKVSEECMEGMKMVSRQYKDGVKTVNRGSLAADLQFQLEERASQDRPPQDRSSQERSSQDRSS